MKNRTTNALRAAFVLCLLYAATRTKAADYYFSSTDGDDSRTAAQAQSPSTPWKSLEKLNAFFATLRPGDNVLFKRGDVFTGTVVATASGSASSPIVLSAYGNGATPVISSLRPLSGWTNTGGNIWEADASFASSAINVALVNGSLQAVGRYPNAGAANGGYLTLESHSGNASITDQQLSSSPDWTGGDVVIRKNRWVLDRSKITSHNGNTLYYASQSGYHASDGYGYFIQNHRAALDQAGEWYFNNVTKKFGIYNSGTPTAVEVGTVNTLLSVTNQNHIVVRNLAFKGANANAVELSNTDGVQLINCEILYSGGNAVLGQGCNGTHVEGCTITETANSALEFRGSHNIVIKSNGIKNTGFRAGAGGGDSGSYEAVLVDGDNETIEGNTIENTGYIPITFRGNSNVIKNNFISTYNTVKDDGGGIYTWNNIAGAAPTYGSKIIGNIVLNGVGAGEGTDDVPYKASNGIYMDDNTAGVEISGNTVAACGLYALYVHNGYGLTITGNTFFNSSSQLMLMHDNFAPAAKVRNVVMTNNIFFSKEAGQLVAEFKTTDNDIASFGSFDNNYYCRPAYENYIINTAMNSDAINLDLSEWKTAFGKDANSRTFPVPAVSYDAIRFEYNASASSKTISLDGTYTDASGTTYNGGITLSPYASAVLVKQAVLSSLCPGTPVISREQWNNTPNGGLNVVSWQATPTKKTVVTGAFEAANIGDAYAARLSGSLCPPLTGAYTFWIAGDDFAELWLSTDNNPANKRKIASISGWTTFRDWNKNGAQKSASINLQAGTKYYIEVLHKEGNGGDHVSVAWQLPDGNFEGPIPGHRFPSGTGSTQQAQTISFEALANVVLGSGTVTLSATATSGLPVSFSIVSGPATLSGNVLTPTAAGTVIVKASQSGNTQYSAAADVTQQLVITSVQANQCSATGTILHEQWNNVAGNDVAQIPLTAVPSSTSQLNSFEGPRDAADQYGSRIRGYICPPSSGNYTFWIAGDDGTELWLSSDDNPSNKTKIAYSLSWTAFREWNWYASQKSASIYLEAGRKYYIEALQKEGGGGDHLSVAWQLPGGTFEAPIAGSHLSPYVPPVVTVPPSTCSATGSILREVWNNVDGNDVSQVPQTTAPSASSQIASFESPSNAADKYASRISGYLCAPQTGSYTFYIAGDDATELWLSVGDDPSAKVKIAYNLSWTNAREWTRFASQKSAAIHLIAGKKYYIEALHKEGAGGDNLAVAWQLPDGTFEAPIAGNRLSPFVATAAATAVRVSLVNQKGSEATAETEKVTEVTKGAPALQVYPNPFSEKVVIEFTPATTGQIVVEIYNSVGIRQAVLYNGAVQKGATQRLTCRQPALAAGVYFVRYRSADGTFVYKLIKK